MAKRKKTSSRVEADGKRLYISVPEGRSRDLHTYLRDNRVRSAPPEPAYTGMDCIELAKNVDVDGIQALLDNWG